VEGNTQLETVDIQYTK